MRARWYDPVTHRFMSQDPIGAERGMSPYTFGRNDPVNNIDPLGLCSLKAQVIIHNFSDGSIETELLYYFWEGDDCQHQNGGYGSAKIGNVPTPKPISDEQATCIREGASQLYEAVQEQAGFGITLFP
jgi:uncharacterized protein RhaS with RHS repeats